MERFWTEHWTTKLPHIPRIEVPFVLKLNCMPRCSPGRISRSSLYYLIASLTNNRIIQQSSNMEGTCLCGAITVRVKDPDLFSRPRGHICRCDNCRKVAGSCEYFARLSEASRCMTDLICESSCNQSNHRERQIRDYRRGESEGIYRYSDVVWNATWEILLLDMWQVSDCLWNDFDSRLTSE